MAFGPEGHLYIADINGVDEQRSRVRRGGATRSVRLSSPNAGDSTGPILIDPRAVAFSGAQGPFVTSADSVLRYDPATQRSSRSSPRSAGFMNDAKDMAFGPRRKAVRSRLVQRRDAGRRMLQLKRYPGRQLPDRLCHNHVLPPPDWRSGPTTRSTSRALTPSMLVGEVLRFNLDGSADGTFISAGGSDPAHITGRRSY